MRASSDRSALLVLTTVETVEEAQRLAGVLVAEGLAACVSHTQVRSVYRWKAAVEEAAETQLIIKTAEDLWEPLARRVAELCSYEVPELVAIRPSRLGQDYLDWLLGACPAVS